jgi:hypothetical protein
MTGLYEVIWNGAVIAVGRVVYVTGEYAGVRQVNGRIDEFPVSWLMSRNR